ncbi:hypothetical protein [Flavihumibacter sp. CACIAM 22H1]|uniref:hypothetical protein n=1 Tax=Flavihumibacter sp. CACIAM 22H1 TaxID=1812911 RepID=UPI0007A846AB|nr:hypothetical protein [Flavihumibacter sp. CACIAM 22H1]KYP14128.1 MAG: hypothetical protein A1D16_19955 [Flavihumibacter sp. CACIAM 22H1]
MFLEIVRFEIIYRLRKPAVYGYFLLLLGFSCLVFMQGFLPLSEGQLVNSPASIALYCSGITMMMSLISSSIMGVPVYRDIEYNTRYHYFSLPIKVGGYFWGRFWGSFLVLLIISLSLPLGIFAGSQLGPMLGTLSADQYGPNTARFYLAAYCSIVVPNLFFSATVFFGLVAWLRTVKAVYSSGIFVLLAYLLGNFFIKAHPDPYLVHLSDPFALNGVRTIIGGWSAADKNSLTLPISGFFLANRCVWSAVGILIILLSGYSFSFHKMLQPGRLIKKSEKELPVAIRKLVPALSFGKMYRPKIAWSLFKVELFNCLRDNYFWIIVLAGTIFLLIVFPNAPANFGMRDFPRTAVHLFLWKENFLVYYYCILFFYAGEVLHREKLVGFHTINDALPPSSAVFLLAKFLAVLVLGCLLLFSTMLTSVLLQLARGYYQFNFQAYGKVLFIAEFPRLISCTLLAFFLHVLVNNKLVAIGIGLAYLVLCLLAVQTGFFNYHLLLFSSTPFYGISDFDTVGHMLVPVSWYNLYWSLCGGLLLLTAYLLFRRELPDGLKSRWQVARARFDKPVCNLALVLLVLFLSVGAYIYYNVSYLNQYLTEEEELSRKALLEKTLKRYESLPIPRVKAIRMTADLFPEKQQALFLADVSLVNSSGKAISELLTNGDFLHRYEISWQQNKLPYHVPLYYPRPVFSFFGPSIQASGYRLYKLPKTMEPGDSITLRIETEYSFTGFQNNLYGANFLKNGALMGICLPDFGYPADEELMDKSDRKKLGLPKIEDGTASANPLADTNRLQYNAAIDLLDFHITISTAADQRAMGSGELVKEWSSGGRNYSTYRSLKQGMYMLPGIVSGSYARHLDTVITESGNVDIELYYHPAHNQNIERLSEAYKKCIEEMSRLFGSYPYPQMRLVETTVYAPLHTNIAATDLFSEQYGWNVNSRLPVGIDYFLFNSARQVARQWWGNLVAPNNTQGAIGLRDGISTFCALLIYERVHGKQAVKPLLASVYNWYLQNSAWFAAKQQPVLSARLPTETDNKTALLLYALKETIGEAPLLELLNGFKENWQQKSAGPYAGIRDLYQYLKKHTPAALEEYLEENWEKICFYEIQVLAAKTRLDSSGNYMLDLTLDAHRLFVGKEGAEQEQPIAGRELDLFITYSSRQGGKQESTKQVVPLQSGINKILLPMRHKPVLLELDPAFKLFNRKRAEAPMAVD